MRRSQLGINNYLPSSKRKTNGLNPKRKKGKRSKNKRSGTSKKKAALRVNKFGISIYSDHCNTNHKSLYAHNGRNNYGEFLIKILFNRA